VVSEWYVLLEDIRSIIAMARFETPGQVVLLFTGVAVVSVVLIALLNVEAKNRKMKGRRCTILISQFLGNGCYRVRGMKCKFIVRYSPAEHDKLLNPHSYMVCIQHHLTICFLALEDEITSLNILRINPVQSLQFNTVTVS
jgi:hypothetical protein